jgi:hypothetical protein
VHVTLVSETPPSAWSGVAGVILDSAIDIGKTGAVT